MSKEVQELFSSIAPSYDFLNHCLSFSIDKRWRHKAIAALERRAPKRVLDLCAGTLDLSKNLATQYPSCEIWAVDFSLAMLEEGKKKIKSHPTIHRICADGHSLPFSDQSFDAVICAFGIRNLEHRNQAAIEIRRVLKKGGCLVVLEFFRPDKLFSKLFYQSYGKYVLPKIGGVISKNRKAYQYLQDSITHFMSVEEYSQLLSEQGLQTIKILPLSGGIAHLVIAEG
jgi:demethylmenaquinone methyltransferase / 2-methoxy-6-polyprenyl-1,4-benzoquinol methylase